MANKLPNQVEYTVRYGDNKPEKPGRFLFDYSKSSEREIFAGIANQVPDLEEAEYIFGSIWSNPEIEPEHDVRTHPIFEFRKHQIQDYLNRLWVMKPI